MAENAHSTPLQALKFAPKTLDSSALSAERRFQKRYGLFMDLITTTPELAAACERLARHPVITVDTEFLRETTYYPLLCVIQMASPEEAVVIDALAEGIDLQPFFDLMGNEKVLKVFHAARQDIEIVWHEAGILPHPIFDTQVAAMVLGYGDSIAYDQLVERITGHRPDKTHRFTDWSRRPLTTEQMHYAVSDVTHLRDVFTALDADLKQRGRSDWVSEEMEVLTSPKTYDFHPERAWERLKTRVRKPKELAVLMEVAAWREQEAQSRDVPRSRVLKDDAVGDIATHAPTSLERLASLRSLPKGFDRSKWGADIIAAVQRGIARDPRSLPKIEKQRNNSNGAAIVELLKVLLRMTSERYAVASKVIATVDDLEQIAADDNADVGALHGWRRELFGEAALALKHGRLALAIEKGRVVRVVATGDISVFWQRRSAPLRMVPTCRAPTSRASCLKRLPTRSATRSTIAVLEHQHQLAALASKMGRRQHARPRRRDQMRDTERRAQNARALDHRWRLPARGSCAGGSFCSLEAGIAIKHRQRQKRPALMTDRAEIAVGDQAHGLFAAVVGMNPPADVGQRHAAWRRRRSSSVSRSFATLTRRSVQPISSSAWRAERDNSSFSVCAAQINPSFARSFSGSIEYSRPSRTP